MGDTWITDMRHFLDILEPDADIPGPARRLAEYLGKIVEAATANPPMVLLNSEIRCQRRPGRKPCVGRLRLVYNENEGEIVWECSSCDERGIIRGFEGTPWDLSLDHDHVGDEFGVYEPTTFEHVDNCGRRDASRSGGPIDVVLDRAEYAAVCCVSKGHEIPKKILDNAGALPNGFKVIATARNIAAFHDYLLEIAMSNKNPSYVQLLGQSIKKMAVALEDYLDEIF